MTLWRLEWMRLVRTRRLAALSAVYAFFGLLGPITARYMGEIIARFGGEIEVSFPDPTPVDGIVQFSANASQIGLLVVMVVAAGSMTFAAIPEMAVFLRTRVGSGMRLLAPRFAVVTGAAAAAYLLGSGLAWYETAVLLGSLPAGPLLLGTALGCLYLAFAVAVAAVFGSRLGGVAATALASLLVLLVLPIAGLLGGVGRWLPSHLVGAQADLVAGEGAAGFLGAAGVTVAATAALLWWAARWIAAREI
jgi:ABC-2 type transport system permease protein